MFKKFVAVLSVLFVLLASVAHAAVVTLAAAYTVASTSFATPPDMTMLQQRTYLSFNGGLTGDTVCAAVITVKDAALANLTVRALFNNSVGGLYGSPTTNADGSKSYTFLKYNPPAQSGVPTDKCQVQAQVKKNGGANVVLDPATGDLYKLEG